MATWKVICYDKFAFTRAWSFEATLDRVGFYRRCSERVGTVLIHGLRVLYRTGKKASVSAEPYIMYSFVLVKEVGYHEIRLRLGSALAFALYKHLLLYSKHKTRLDIQSPLCCKSCSSMYAN